MAPPTQAEDAIRQLIGARGAISFAEFMALALYHPDEGYYTRAEAATGREGDFSTSPDVSPAFGRRLAVQAADVWDRLGGGEWRIVELGPGRGLLATDLLTGLADLAPAAMARLKELIMVEVSPSLAAQQAKRVEAAAPRLRVRWIRRLDELSPALVTGLVLGNEVLDALPVHLVARRGDQLAEQFVAVDDRGRLHFIDRPPTDPRLADRVARFGLAARDGDRAEVCLDLEPFLGHVGRVLACGAALFVDYGHPASRLADENHADGTLLAYRGHRVVFDLLADPGLQDLTAHVNWDHLADAAAAAGLDFVGRTTQDRFLLALGILDDLALPAAGPAAETPDALARRLAARSLIMPGAGGGKRFEAVAFTRDIAPDLRGFSDPFAAPPA